MGSRLLEAVVLGWLFRLISLCISYIVVRISYSWLMQSLSKHMDVNAPLRRIVYTVLITLIVAELIYAFMFFPYLSNYSHDVPYNIWHF